VLGGGGKSKSNDHVGLPEGLGEKGKLGKGGFRGKETVTKIAHQKKRIHKAKKRP